MRDLPITMQRIGASDESGGKTKYNDRLFDAAHAENITGKKGKLYILFIRELSIWTAPFDNHLERIVTG